MLLNLVNTPERGEIRNAAFARQLLDFKKLRFGTITPTDIDGFIEVKGNVFVFLEIKYGDTEMPRGQSLALERLTDLAFEANKKSLLILAKHNLTSEQPIPCDACEVVRYRFEKEWHLPFTPMNCLDLLTDFFTRHAPEILNN